MYTYLIIIQQIARKCNRNVEFPGFVGYLFFLSVKSYWKLRNIQTIRMNQNLTQMQVVERMQLSGSTMSRSTLANIEAGRRNIKASDLKTLKMILNVNYDDFFED